MARRKRSLVGFGLLLVAIFNRPLLADTQTSLGEHGGEGSTPFTGLAQTPEANLFTGTLGTTVPIEVPPGRKNITPKLALQYSSAGGPSVYGYGWDLPIGKVQRSTKWGTPRCSGPHQDDFVLTLPSGTVELSADSSGLITQPPADATVYRPKIDEGYLEAQAFKNSIANYWVVYDRSGTKFVFGNTAAARLGNYNGNDGSVFGPVIGSDGLCHFTSVWALTHVEDPNGNSMDITYGWSPLYPTSIRYGGNTHTGLSNFDHVDFTYEGRPDQIENDLIGTAVILLYRVKQIRVRTDVPTLNTAVRTYEAAYVQSTSGHSLLASISVITGNYPTQHFAYAPDDAGVEGAPYQPPAGSTVLRHTNGSGEVWRTVMDINGDALPDIVVQGSPNWSVYLGTRNGPQTTATPWHIPTAIQGWAIRDEIMTGDCSDRWSCVDTDTFDIDGDGFADYIDAHQQCPSQGACYWNVYRGTGTGFADQPTSWLVPSYPGNVQPIRRDFHEDGDGRRTHQDVLDVNGDGLPDLVSYGWFVYLNTGSGFETSPIAYQSPPDPSIRLEYPTTTNLDVMDFNGDGLIDVVFSRYDNEACMTDFDKQGNVPEAVDSLS